MNIRAYQHHDWPYLNHIDIKSYEEVWDEECYRIATNLLVCSTYRPVGFIAWTNIGRMTVIDKLCVWPRERFKGGGSLLLETCLKTCNRPRVIVEAPLEHADWLLRRGFLANGDSRELYGQELIIMERAK